MDIKEFIRQHKDEFDDQDFNENLVWNKIEVDLDRQSKFKLRPLKWAASFLLIVVAAGLLFQIGYNQGQKKLDEVITEWGKVEEYYNNKYTSLLTSFEQSQLYDAGTKSSFMKTMEVLADENIKLKLKLKEDHENEELLATLIENFKTQIAALEYFLNPIKKENNEIDEKQYMSL